MNNHRLSVKWHDAQVRPAGRTVFKGDEKIGDLLLCAWQKGCRFDGWSEILRFDLWQEAIRETGINVDDYLRERATAETLPGESIDCGVSRDFLLSEGRFNGGFGLPSWDFSGLQSFRPKRFSVFLPH